MEIFKPPGERRYPSWGLNYRGYYDQEKLQIFCVSKFSRMTEKVMKIHCFPGFISKISFAKPQKSPKSIQKVRNCIFFTEIGVFNRFTSRKTLLQLCSHHDLPRLTCSKLVRNHWKHIISVKIPVEKLFWTLFSEKRKPGFWSRYPSQMKT